MTTNKEVYHEGWLIKSPPTKRIWRARWRRRWFTLKQGELPGQFFLEYYTDRKCRKLKGIIDLDQCEQVDAGLRLDRQKEKYAHMFDVKTPGRTYYLAADTEADMRGWVNCICQVCNLQETQTVDERPYYNIGAINMADAVNMAEQVNHNNQGNSSSFDHHQQDLSNETQITLLQHSSLGEASEQHQQVQQQQPLPRHSLTVAYNPYGTYQNEEAMNYRGSEYTNRATIVCEANLSQSPLTKNCNVEAYSNLGTIERSQSLRGKPCSPEKAATGHATLGCHARTQSLNTDHKLSASASLSSVKKIPENLKLHERTTGFESEPSPALSTSSGPYIPISECFSGSPITPMTPLNSLDPRFYDTPRSHTNIGLNLISHEQPYSPKRNNVSSIGATEENNAAGSKAVAPSGKSSPSDSESVFTDDEGTAPAVADDACGTTKDRSTRPSDSSVENDAIGWTYVQRFAKISQDEQRGSPAPPRPPKRTSLILDSIDRHREIQSSDTENASPAIGPKDSSSCVDEFYDIPRSHQPGQYADRNMHLSEVDLLSPLSQCDLVASSTPNLASDHLGGSQCGTLGRAERPHCYTNAAPQRIEGTVFRFDFSEPPVSGGRSDVTNAPAINRNLKPKSTIDITKSVECISHGLKQTGLNASGSVGTPITPKNAPPSVDRTRKPSTPKIDTNSMRRKGGPVVLQSENLYGNTPVPLLPPVGTVMSSKNEDRLQYLDLDHSDSAPKPAASGLDSHDSGYSEAGKHHHLNPSRKTTANDNSVPIPAIARTPYTTVDFVKTDAFNRIRADSEMNRNQSRLKDQS